MKKLVWIAILATLCPSKSALSQEQPSPSSKTDALVFREPFTLKLRVDKDHYYEEPYDKRIPYVADDDVYLFSGENFGVNLGIKDDEVVELTYQPNIKKADVWFSFAQEKELVGGIGIMLIIQNKLKRGVQMDALMTVPGKKEIYKTSILPVEAGLSHYESWPHPIVQLVLRNFRLSGKPAGKPRQ